MGDMVEYGETDQIFQRPQDKRLNDYLTGMLQFLLSFRLHHIRAPF